MSEYFILLVGQRKLPRKDEWIFSACSATMKSYLSWQESAITMKQIKYLFQNVNLWDWSYVGRYQL